MAMLHLEDIKRRPFWDLRDSDQFPIQQSLKYRLFAERPLQKKLNKFCPQIWSIHNTPKLVVCFFSKLSIKTFWVFKRNLATVWKPKLLNSRNIQWGTHFFWYTFIETIGSIVKFWLVLINSSPAFSTKVLVRFQLQRIHQNIQYLFATKAELLYQRAHGRERYSMKSNQATLPYNISAGSPLVALIRGILRKKPSGICSKIYSHPFHAAKLTAQSSSHSSTEWVSFVSRWKPKNPVNKFRS